MVVRIRLMRTGRKNLACYRICAFDGRTARGGKTLEILGHYDPLSLKKEKQIILKKERIEHWLAVGAQPSETVASFCRDLGVTMPAAKSSTRTRKRGVQRKKKQAKKLARKAKAASKA